MIEFGVVIFWDHVSYYVVIRSKKPREIEVSLS